MLTEWTLNPDYASLQGVAGSTQVGTEMQQVRQKPTTLASLIRDDLVANSRPVYTLDNIHATKDTGNKRDKIKLAPYDAVFFEEGRISNTGHSFWSTRDFLIYI